MADETTGDVSTPTETSTETTVDSIESIASSFGLSSTGTGTPEQPPRQEAAPTTQTDATLPDPLSDPDGFAKWQTEQAKHVNSMFGELSQELGALRAERETAAQAKTEREFNQIIDRVHEQLGKTADKDLVKYALADRYNTDPAFRAIVDARNSKPEALERALPSVTQRLAEKFRTAADPQIAENQRAMNEGSRATSTSQSDSSPEAKLMGMPQAEFDQWWMRRTGGA